MTAGVAMHVAMQRGVQWANAPRVEGRGFPWRRRN